MTPAGLWPGPVSELNHRPPSVARWNSGTRTTSVVVPSPPLGRSSLLAEVTRDCFPIPMVVAALLAATRRLGMMLMSVSVMVVVTPAMVVVMWKFSVSSSPPPVWCHHPPSPTHSVWIPSLPPLPPPPRMPYGVDAGPCLSIEQKY